MPEDVPVFYTRAQLREMGQLDDDDEEEYWYYKLESFYTFLSMI